MQKEQYNVMEKHYQRKLEALEQQLAAFTGLGDTSIKREAIDTQTSLPRLPTATTTAVSNIQILVATRRVPSAAFPYPDILAQFTRDIAFCQRTPAKRNDWHRPTMVIIGEFNVQCMRSRSLGRKATVDSFGVACKNCVEEGHVCFQKMGSEKPIAVPLPKEVRGELLEGQMGHWVVDC